MKKTIILDSRIPNEKLTKREYFNLLSDVIFQFPLNGQWPKSRTKNDSIICTLQAIGILTPEEAKQLRDVGIVRELPVSFYYEILDNKLKIGNWKEVEVSDVTLNELKEQLRPNHGMILTLKSIIPNMSNHTVLLAKNIDGSQTGIVDAQNRLTFTTREQITNYLKFHSFDPRSFRIVVNTDQQEQEGGQIEIVKSFFIENLLCSEVMPVLTTSNRLKWIKIINIMFSKCFPYSGYSILKNFSNAMNNYLTRFIFLHNNKRPLAFCFVRNDGYIHTVCVSKGGQGLCSLLMGYIAAHFNNIGLYLHVRVDSFMGQGLPPNVAAFRCYQKHGFLLIKQTCEPFPDGLNCIMKRPANGHYYDLSNFYKNIKGDEFDLSLDKFEIAKDVYLLYDEKNKYFKLMK